MAPSRIVSVPRDPFVATAGDVYRGPIFLAQISLPAFGASPARELRLSTSEYIDPDGVPWEPIIAAQPSIDHGGSFMESGFQPVDAEITILDKRITGQAVTETFFDLFTDYEISGARVVFYQAFSNLTSTAQFRTIFTGAAVEFRDMGPSTVKLWCVQSRSFARSIPPNKLTATDFPYAPTDNIGVPRPILIGDWETGTKTIAAGIGTLDETWRAGVTRAAFPTMTVELESAAGAATSPKVMASDKDMLSNPEVLLYYENQLGVYAASFAALSVTGSGPVYGQLADYQFGAAIIPIELDATTTATDGQELIRKDKRYDLTGRATLDFNAGKKVIRLRMPDVSPLGTFVDAYAYIWYNKPLTSGSHPRWGVENATTTNNLVAFSAGATTPSSSDTPHDSTSMHIGPTALGGSNTIYLWEHIKDTTLLVEVRNAGETMDIHRFVLFIVYKPASRLISAGTSVIVAEGPRYDAAGRRVSGPPLETGKTFRKHGPSTTPDVTSFDAPLFAYGTGVPDDSHSSGVSDGTYTGTASALIEHPCDVAHWALRELGGMAAQEIVTASGDFGSFEDARTTLSGYKMRCQIAQQQTVEDFIESIGAQTLTWFFRRGNTPAAPWVAVPWDTASSVDYRSPTGPYTFTNSNSDIREGTLMVDRTPATSVFNAIRVNYDYDPRSRAYADQLYITPDGSRVYSGGFTTDGTRVTTATTSEGLYGRLGTTLNLTYVRDPATASSILTRLFDLRVQPRLVVKFSTWMNAFDLERGHVIQLSSDWDSFLTYPKPGSDGSWASKKFRVIRLRRSADQPTSYGVIAVEV